MLLSRGFKVNLWKPATISAMPLPHVVAPDAPISTGGTPNHRQISSTPYLRLSRSCDCSGVKATCWNFMSASSTIIFPDSDLKLPSA